jgi:hypothetical protein
VQPLLRRVGRRLRGERMVMGNKLQLGRSQAFWYTFYTRVTLDNNIVLYISKSYKKGRPGLEANTCNPSYLRGGDGRIMVLG